MTCTELTNDQMLAPTAEASSHLAGCEECRERQHAVALAVRAMRALAGEHTVPDANDMIIRAAIPQLAADAARRRPAGWWQVAAAAAVLLAAVIGGLKFTGSRPAPSGKAVVADRDEPGAARPPADVVKISPPPVIAEPPPPVDPKVPPPPDPTPVDPKDPEPPGGRGYLAGGELPPIADPPAVHPPPPGLPRPADSLADATVADCMEIMRTVLGEGEPVARDYNGDGVTDIIDAYIVARRVAGKEDLK